MALVWREFEPQNAILRIKRFSSYVRLASNRIVLSFHETAITVWLKGGRISLCGQPRRSLAVNTTKSSSHRLLMASHCIHSIYVSLVVATQSMFQKLGSKLSETFVHSLATDPVGFQKYVKLSHIVNWTNFKAFLRTCPTLPPIGPSTTEWPFFTPISLSKVEVPGSSACQLAGRM